MELKLPKKKVNDTRIEDNIYILVMTFTTFSSFFLI